MKHSSLDPLAVRWYAFFPGAGRFAIPGPESGRELPAIPAGATRLFCGNDVRWSADQAKVRHLAVVR